MSSLAEQVKVILSDIQQNLFDNAKQKRDARVKVVNIWNEFVTALSEKKLFLLLGVMKR